MTQRASVAADATPLSAAERQAYIDTRAPHWRPLEIGTPLFLPLLGGAHIEWRHDLKRAFRSWDDVFHFRALREGELEFWSGRLSLVANMPEGWFDAPERARGCLAMVWWGLGFPVLISLLIAKALLRAVWDTLEWRLKRIALHLAWTLRPAAMDAKVVGWRAEEAASAARHAELVAALEAREAARRAGENAEIERRVAERMAALGVA